MNAEDLRKIALFARLGADVVELGVTTVGRLKALLASDGHDDEALQAAIARLDAAVARAKAEAGLS